MNEEAGSKIRVLVVDDEPAILKVLGIELKLSGYEVITTTSGAEAIELVRNQEPDIVLLDVVMPETSGLEVLQQVRKFSQVPIIIFTGHPTVIKLALQNGATESISKPFDPDLLVAKMRLVLHPHRIGRAQNGVQRQDPHR